MTAGASVRDSDLTESLYAPVQKLLAFVRHLLRVLLGCGSLCLLALLLRVLNDVLRQRLKLRKG